MTLEAVTQVCPVTTVWANWVLVAPKSTVTLQWPNPAEARAAEMSEAAMFLAVHREVPTFQNKVLVATAVNGLEETSVRCVWALRAVGLNCPVPVSKAKESLAPGGQVSGVIPSISPADTDNCLLTNWDPSWMITSCSTGATQYTSVRSFSSSALTVLMRCTEATVRASKDVKS